MVDKEQLTILEENEVVLDRESTKDILKSVEAVKAVASKKKTKQAPRPIYQGVATTNVNEVKAGEQVVVYEDKQEDWLTDKGLVPKIYLLLKKIN